MTQVNLPRTNQTGPNEWSDVEANDAALQAVINGQLGNDNIEASAGIVATKLAGEIPRSKLAADAKPVTWYTPKVIATEQTRESTSFGTLTTADEIPGVVVPAGGEIKLSYIATWKSSVAAAGFAAVFLGANQVLAADARTGYAQTSGTSFLSLVSGYTSGTGFPLFTGGTRPAGEFLAVEEVAISAPAGTYNVSVQFRASSGSVTVKERDLSLKVYGY